MGGSIVQDEIKASEHEVTIIQNETGSEAPKETENEKLYAGKYKSTEELERAYVELQKKLGEKQTQSSDSNEEDKQEKSEDEIEKNEKEATEVLKVAGLDMSNFTKEYEEKGELSEESFKELEDKGFPRSLVEAYIEGQKALSQNQQYLAEKDAQELKKVVEDFDAMAQWASKNATKEQIDAYNKAVDTGNKELIKMAISSLNDVYLMSTGKAPSLVRRGASSQTGIVPFKSANEIVAAMKDERYKKGDEAYINEVQQRIRMSNF